MSEQQLKRQVGAAALAFLEEGMILGVGTGSTVNAMLDQLQQWAPRLKGAVSSSVASTARLEALGIPVLDLNEVDGLGVYIDGADESNGRLELIKGGGAALTREKIVASMAERFVVVVDETKLVPALGPFGTPLEVLGFAPGVVAAAVEALGAAEVVARPIKSDNGNLIMDARFGTIPDPLALAAELAAVPGLVEHGIFPGAMVERVVVAGADGTRELVNR